MIYHLLLVIGCIISIELFLRMSFFNECKKILNSSKKAKNRILSKKISDHWKEIVVIKYAIEIMKSSIKIFVILFLIFSTFYILSFSEIGFFAYMMSIIGIIEAIIVSSIYIKLRQLFYNE
tara:strand:- start:65 stop:427 length:363 start_codon:yes stop_codon:yes gene_type:complete